MHFDYMEIILTCCSWILFTGRFFTICGVGFRLLHYYCEQLSFEDEWSALGFFKPMKGVHYGLGI